MKKASMCYLDLCTRHLRKQQNDAKIFIILVCLSNQIAQFLKGNIVIYTEYFDFCVVVDISGRTLQSCF